MKYFKHSELTERYRVSLKTVHNWIDAAKQGKITLKLHTTASNRTYVADTPENILVLKQLAEKGKKFRNGRHHKIIHPKPEFYDILSRRQILDVITNLSVHREIPRQYCYLNEGAASWDDWVKRLAASEKTTNILKGSQELLRLNMNVIDHLTENHKRINVIDLGAGNAYPVRDFLTHLQKKGILHRYIALDISPEMLKIARRNVYEWFGKDFPYEGHVRDITHEHFDDLLVDDMLNDETEQTLNLVLVLGGTPTNFRTYNSIFKTAHESMSNQDLLIYTDKPDTESSRSYFDFGTTADNKLSANHQNGYLLNLLNIDGSLYEVEMGFDKDEMMRYLQVRLKTAITLQFDFEDIKRNVSIERGETILLLRIRHLSALDIITAFQKEGLTLLQSSLTKDRQFFLSISGVETKQSQPE